MKKKKCTAIVLAAGQGKRMGTKVQKQFLELKEKPLLYYSLKAFQDSGQIDSIILVTGEEHIAYVRREIVETYGFSKVDAITAGGAERCHSVWNGICVMTDERNAWANTDGYVFIHDGARPFVTEEILQRAYDAVQQEKACVVGMPVKDTVKLADENGFAAFTPERSIVWSVQTPQAFAVPLIRAAYQALLFGGGEQATDDATAVERMTGEKVKLVEGSYRNIKITTPEDMLLAEALADAVDNPFCKGKKCAETFQKTVDTKGQIC